MCKAKTENRRKKGRCARQKQKNGYKRNICKQKTENRIKKGRCVRQKQKTGYKRKICKERGILEKKMR